MNLFDLQAKIALDTNDYTKGLDGAQKKTSSFGSKLKSGLATAGKAGAAAIGAVTAAVGLLSKKLLDGAKQTADYGDEVDKMSQKLGLSTDAYQEWDYVLGQAGVEITSMSTGLKTLTNKIDDAKNGSEDAAAMFEKLGISLEDLNTMSREEIFAEVIGGFQDMADSTERAALANDLFGKSGQELAPLFNETKEATDEMRKSAHDLGFVMSSEAVKASAEYKDSLDTLRRTVGGLKNKLSGEFLPALTKINEGLTAIFAGDKSGLSQVTEGIKNLMDNISKIMPTVIEVGGQILTTLATAIIENMPQIVDTAIPIMISFVMALIEQLPMLVEAGGQMLMKLVEAINENIEMIVEAAVEILLTLANGLVENLPKMIPAIVDIIIKITETLIEHVDELVDASIAIIIALAEGLIAAVPKLIEKAPEIVIKLVVALVENAPKLIEAGIQLIVKLVEGIVNSFSKIWEVGKDLIGKLWEGIKSVFSSVVQWGSQIIDKVKEGISSVWARVKEIGSNLIHGIWEGISSAASWLWEKVRGWANSLISGIKGMFGIASPSKVFAEMGKYTIQGFGKGFDDNFKAVSDDVKDKLDSLSDESVKIAADVSGSAPDSLFGSYEQERSKNDSTIITLLERGITMMQQLIDNAGHDLVLDTGVLVGTIDRELGAYSYRAARGN